jgi:hypothetical protein
MDLVVSCSVIDDAGTNMSDHLPVYMKLNVSPLCNIDSLYDNVTLKWRSVSRDYVTCTYGMGVENKLEDIKCAKLDNSVDIDSYYSILVQHLKITAT